EVVWHLRFPDASGTPVAVQAMTSEVKLWLSTVPASMCDTILASKSVTGPFDPVLNFPELRDPDQSGVQSSKLPVLLDSHPQAPTGQSSASSVEWVKWMALAALATGLGILVLKFFI